MLGPVVYASFARGKVLDWVGLFYSDDLAMATPPPYEETGVFAVLYPFSLWVNESHFYEYSLQQHSFFRFGF